MGISVQLSMDPVIFHQPRAWRSRVSCIAYQRATCVLHTDTKTLRMLLAGRGYGWARSALVASRRKTRLSQHVTGSGVVGLTDTTDCTSQQPVGVRGVATGGGRHRGGRQQTSTSSVEDAAEKNSSASKGSSKVTTVRRKGDDVGVGPTSVDIAMRGQERGKSTMATDPTRRTAASVENSHNWTEYQVQLQARVGLLPEEKAAKTNIANMADAELHKVAPNLTRKKKIPVPKAPTVVLENIAGGKVHRATPNPSRKKKRPVPKVPTVVLEKLSDIEKTVEVVNSTVHEGRVGDSDGGSGGGITAKARKRRERRLWPSLTKESVSPQQVSAEGTVAHVAGARDVQAIDAKPADPVGISGQINGSTGSCVEGAITERVGSRDALTTISEIDMRAGRNGQTNGSTHGASAIGEDTLGSEFFQDFTSQATAAAPTTVSKRKPQGVYSSKAGWLESTSSSTTVIHGDTNTGSSAAAGQSGSSFPLPKRARPAHSPDIKNSSWAEVAEAAGVISLPMKNLAGNNGSSDGGATLRPQKKNTSGTVVDVDDGVMNSAARRHARKEQQYGENVQKPVVPSSYPSTGIGTTPGMAPAGDFSRSDLDEETAATRQFSLHTIGADEDDGVASSAAFATEGDSDDDGGGDDDDDYEDTVSFLEKSRISSASPAPNGNKGAGESARCFASPSDSRLGGRQSMPKANGRGEKPRGFPRSQTDRVVAVGGASAWQNVHARRNLQMLLDGLGSDYGVTVAAKDNYVPKRTLAKVLPIFQKQVLTQPDVAFPGESGKRVQEEISKLCYNPDFRGDAVTRKNPQRVTQRHGRAFNFQSAKTADRSGFTVVRAQLVEDVFVPRLTALAKDLFPQEVENARILLEAVDLSNPHEWFPLARLRKRKIIYHGGPTNSGKTYNAINRLKEAGAKRQPGDPPTGIFCGPLRLLALEVYEQLNSQGVYCSLYTGQEKRSVPFATHVSCTIEMASLTQPFEVAVIDEIQMVDDPQRGQNWTNALMGLNCPEIHVCGGLEAAKLVELLCEKMGDDFELHEYARKTPLVTADESLGGSYEHVQPGDAIVAFTRKDIFTIKSQIESRTNHKCCVVYGQLPQETRAHQARLFNTPGTGYDVLVASDAIGMGLNLNIGSYVDTRGKDKRSQRRADRIIDGLEGRVNDRRVVFHAVSKRTKSTKGLTPLQPTLLKQIGGRAGRHGKEWNFGEVTCMYEKDMEYMKHVMATPIEQIPRAHIFPLQDRVQAFADSLDIVAPMADGNRRRLGDILEAIAREALVPDLFVLGEFAAIQKLADAVHNIDDLTMAERFTICQAPINERNEDLVRAVAHFAAAHSERLPAFVNMHLPARGALPRTLDEFAGICNKHAVLEVYKWMAQRFPEIESPTQLALAEKQKVEVVDLIYKALKTNVKVNGISSIGTMPHYVPDPSITKELTHVGGGIKQRGARAPREHKFATGSY